MAAVVGAGNALDKDSHLLVQMLKPAPFPVIQRREAACTGIDGADGGFKRMQALLRCSVIAAEDEFVFPGKGVMSLGKIVMFTALLLGWKKYVGEERER